ncbi:MULTISPECIES: bifunctional nuclease family protein [unclassified Mucilaginibacter]|uniref:bifunctional nuclease family protein n=1 Tax=unclassified Mucilaginibacter TaxID=2617802 RepID=UPI002AC89682|nr:MULTISPECIES: bifunctional nuclease family protein [unclassified Mucilaginibacter]MEB0262327.1 bifunctional nuclease family protein [Mucilaginibacter sp. 10I4]MEB0279974.1 bifunctional nuclease family protein [Mucilaginibacter sp. 10B2]MEB0301783.1 bifunctional nuclease family protein [Mucilaginibacter sp. 5C4]WPX25719.1 bifunctional nuclease family protein [Mucilaginibacter sp. 5C4]
MKKIKLDIVGLSYSQTQSGAYALVLGEISGRRRLPIIIGSFEAQAIAIEIEKMTPSRPLTHDLFKSLGQAFNITVQEVIIYNLVDGIFYSKLICFDGKKTVEIDARTSDAIAVSVRFECPIYTYEFILSTAGIVIEGNDFVYLENISETPEEKTRTSATGAYTTLSEDELKNMLQQALSEEAYEKAAKIRDELTKRKSS